VNTRVRRTALSLCVVFVCLFGMLNYLQVVHAEKLDDDPRNFRRIVRDYANPRGDILDANGVVVATSTPTDDQYEYLRTYPYGALFGNVTGFYSFQYGATDIEDVYNEQLTGRDPKIGAADLVDLLRGRVRTGTVQLTIDARAQQLARDALGGHQGSVVVLDAQTGAVVALYQEPAFDPTVISSHDIAAAQADYTALNAQQPNPMLSRSYRERFPPGSTFKIVTAATALSLGRVTPETEFPVLTQLDLPQTDRTLANFGGEACGGSLTESFTDSCNTVFGQIGLDLGDDLATGINAWGIGQDVPFDLRAAKGTAPTAGSFQDNQPLFAQAAIGQAEVSVSPLQMAMVAATVANGGQQMRPHIVDKILDVDNKVVDQTKPEVARTPVTPDVAATVRDLMVGVVDHGTGTAAQIEGIQVAGKTGTAQVAEGVNPHAWFVGFAPAVPQPGQRQYAVAVIIENGGSLGSEATGGRIAAPVAKAMLEGLLTGQLPAPIPPGFGPVPGTETTVPAGADTTTPADAPTTGG
jgi:penicillin-binding protein A